MRDDFPRVESLLHRCGLHIEDRDDRFSENFCVAEEGGEVIAACGLEKYGPYGLLRSVAVDAAHRGIGLGDAVVADRLNQAGEMSLRRIFLLTLDTARYFERFGFAVIERDELPSEVKASHEYSTLCPATATVMRLDIEGPER